MNDDEAAQAMRSAPVILAIEVIDRTMTADVRTVGKPAETGGAVVYTIPLHLARIRAKVLLTLRGTAGKEVEFYTWLWASGKHGGRRLFNPFPETRHVVFLRQEGEYLHTVGDYPAHDLVLYSRLVPEILPIWRSTSEFADDPVTRFVVCRLRAEFDTPRARQLIAPEEDPDWVPTEYGSYDTSDLIRLMGDLFIANQMDNFCRNSTDRFGRISACLQTETNFPGRCEALRIAREAAPEGAARDRLTERLGICEMTEAPLIDGLRAIDPAAGGIQKWERTPERRRERLRLHTTAMDPEVRQAACEAAAGLPEGRDLPECAAAEPK